MNTLKGSRQSSQKKPAGASDALPCKVEGCDRRAAYKEQAVCQRHYFRFMRNGTYELTRKPRLKLVIVTPNGYTKMFDPNHPLAMSDGFVYAHRRAVFSQYGNSLPPCELCGKKTSWRTCHVDHRDRDKANNAAYNLRPLCRGCNVWRDARASIRKYEYDGQRMPLTNWARQPGVTGCRATLARRIQQGMAMKDVLFMRNVTRPIKKI